MNKTVLAVNALDPSGATGIAVDLRMVQNFRFYCCPVLTGIFYKNTRTLTSLHLLPFEQVAAEFDAVTEDMHMHGAKFSGILDPALARLMAALASSLKAAWTVFNPHFFHRDEHPLLPMEHIPVICRSLFPVVSCVILTVKEAEAVLGRPVRDPAEMRDAAQELHAMGAHVVVVTGGGSREKAVDVLYEEGRAHLLEADRHATDNLLGLGDAFAAFVLCSLLKGLTFTQAIQQAKMYLHKTMLHSFAIGKGLHPINLNTPL
jgi:hydroxymethylpyrimidine/phosphomethylpyrimidine kinase